MCPFEKAYPLKEGGETVLYCILLYLLQAVSYNKLLLEAHRGFADPKQMI